MRLFYCSGGLDFGRPALLLDGKLLSQVSADLSRQ
jgi:hypothetical protein